MTGIEPRSQRWEARVLPHCHRGPHQGYRKRAGGTVTGWLCNGTHAKTEETKRYKEKKYNKGDNFDEKAQMRHIRHILVVFFLQKIK